MTFSANLQNDKILIIDAYAMMYRSFYAVKFSPQFNGQDIGMVYGCITTIFQLLEQFNPAYVVIAFDSKEKTFRHELDENYKAHRKKAPDEFYAQISFVESLIETLKIPVMKQSGFEADDLIGTLAQKAAKKNITSYIASGDLDFLQLMSDSVFLAKFNGKDPLIFDRALTFDKLGVYPEQVIDFKAISGDSSDNYKGIPGVGPKTTVQLLTDYQNIDNILLNLDSLKPKLREKFNEHRDYLMHCRKLAEICLTAPVDFNFNEKFIFDLPPVLEFLDKMNLVNLKKRAESLNKVLNHELNFSLSDSLSGKTSSSQASLF